jgi:hypothetical protein
MRLGPALLSVVLASGGAFAQSVISAHSGVVHYVEGDVAIDGSAINPRFGEFPDLKNGQVLSTEEGRAEVLLTPGVFLRLAEDSSVRMISNALADTHLQVVSGSALIEAGELLPNNAITIESAGVRIAIPKKGLYGVDAASARLRVYDGQASVSLGDQQVVARKAHEIALDSDTLTDSKFDVKDTDPFYRWNARRAEYIADANVMSARVASNSSAGSGFFNGGAATSAWNWNPYFGMFTFMPGTGMYASPFGSVFYSPGLVNTAYFPVFAYGGPAAVGGTPVASVSAPQSLGRATASAAGLSSAGGASRPAGHAGGHR